MLYLFAVINLILTTFSGLAFFNIYKSTKGLGLLEIGVLFISLVLLIVTNIGIIWVNTQRGSIISELKKKNSALEQELNLQKNSINERKDTLD